MPITEDAHLKDHYNRCRLVVIGSTQLDEKDCLKTLNLYGSIKKLMMTKNRRALFVDFECEHSPLLIARSYLFSKSNSEVPMPKGVALMLPGCSFENFLYLQHIPRSVSTMALQRYFSDYTSSFIIHRPGTTESPFSRAVIELNGMSAQSITRQQMQICSVNGRGLEYQFYAIPHLKQLTDVDILNKSGRCRYCNVTDVLPLIAAEEMQRAREPAKRLNNPVDTLPKLNDVSEYSSSRRVFDQNQVSLPPSRECAPYLDNVWHSFPVDICEFEKRELSSSPLPISHQSIHIRRPFETDERLDDEPERCPSDPRAMKREEEEMDYRNQGNGVPSDPKHSTIEELNWRSYDNLGARTSSIGSSPLLTSIPPLLSLSIDAPQVKNDLRRDRNREKHPFSDMQFVRPVRRVSHQYAIGGTGQNEQEEAMNRIDTPNLNQLIGEEDSSWPQAETHRQKLSCLDSLDNEHLVKHSSPRLTDTQDPSVPHKGKVLSGIANASTVSPHPISIVVGQRNRHLDSSQSHDRLHDPLQYNSSHTTIEFDQTSGEHRGSQIDESTAKEERGTTYNKNLSRTDGRLENTESSSATMKIEVCAGWRAGNRCVYELKGKKRKATVRWIGRLRGLDGVYAGLEFDDRIGQGTGVYQEQELFRTSPNHAGFVLLSAISRPVIWNSSNVHLSIDRSQKEEENAEMRSGENKARECVTVRSNPPSSDRLVTMSSIRSEEDPENALLKEGDQCSDWSTELASTQRCEDGESERGEERGTELDPSLEAEKSSMEDRPVTQDEESDQESDISSFLVSDEKEKTERDSDDLLSGEEDQWTYVGHRPLSGLSSVFIAASLPDTMETEEQAYYANDASPKIMEMEVESNEAVRDLIESMVQSVAGSSSTVLQEDEDTVYSRKVPESSDEETIDYDNTSGDNSVPDESLDTVVEEGDYGRFVVDAVEWRDEDLIESECNRLSIIEEDSREEDAVSSVCSSQQDVFMYEDDEETQTSMDGNGDNSENVKNEVQKVMNFVGIEEKEEEKEEDKVLEAERRGTVCCSAPGACPWSRRSEVDSEEEEENADYDEEVEESKEVKAVEMKEEVSKTQRDISAIDRFWNRRSGVDSGDEEDDKEEMIEEGRLEENGNESPEGTLFPSTSIANLDIIMSEEVHEKTELEQRDRITRWSGKSVVDEDEEVDYRSMESEYYNWLTREDREIRGDSLDCCSDSESEIVPMPSTLQELTWGTGIEIEDKTTVNTVLTEDIDIPVTAEQVPETRPIVARSVFGRVVPSFGRPQDYRTPNHDTVEDR